MLSGVSVTYLWVYQELIIELHFMLLRLSFKLWVWHRGPHFLNSFLIFSLSHMLFISWSEVKFLCGIIVTELWNSSYVVLTIKCVFILKMICFLSFLRHIIKHYTQLVEKACDIKYYVKKICNSIIQFSQCVISTNISVLNNFWYKIWGAHSGEDS